eukprot:c47180_g1_i1 orf=255-1100(+)
MRVRKQKINRRTVRFYKTCFGFREPFKVLCDGTFLHYILSHKMGSANDLFSSLLSAPTRTYITRCSVAELKKLGESFSATVLAARRLNAAWCNHDPLKSASDCLRAIVGDGNSDHFFVATQDADLRKRLRQIPGVAVVLAQNNFLILEPPSEKQQAFANTNEAERIHMKELEYKLIKAQEGKKKIQISLGAQNPSEDMETVDTIKLPATQHKHRKNLGTKDSPQFKRKRTKGPNPLSCKKKRVKLLRTEEQLMGDDKDKPRSRRRHRRHPKKSYIEADHAG